MLFKEGEFLVEVFFGRGQRKYLDDEIGAPQP